MNVLILWHTELPGGGEDSKLLGVYSSRRAAEAAQARTVQLPGFRDAPDGFWTGRYEINQDLWPEGYVTVSDRRG